MERILTENELAYLIRLSSPGRCVNVSFGVGPVRLFDEPGNKWAFEELNRKDTESPDYVIQGNEDARAALAAYRAVPGEVTPYES